MAFAPSYSLIFFNIILPVHKYTSNWNYLICTKSNHHSIDETGADKVKHAYKLNNKILAVYGVSCSYEGSEPEGKYITHISINIPRMILKNLSSM